MAYKRVPDSIKKYGFVYIWRDRKHKRYYVGSHWGTIDDGYICSSRWMRRSYNKRPSDFKRRILKITTGVRDDLYTEEQLWLNLIKPSEIKPINDHPRYYNLAVTVKNPWYRTEEGVKTVGEKISKAKKGKKTGPRDPSVGIAISKAKQGKSLTEAHKDALRKVSRKPWTAERKAKHSITIKKQWDTGKRKKKSI